MMRHWLFIALLFHLFAAFFGVGFYHYDEHFQILEFAAYKLGMASALDLPWEFAAKIRPWLMPAIFTGMAKGWRFFGVDDPFAWAFSFRFLSAGLGWINIVLLLKWVLPQWSDSKGISKMAVIATVLFWPLPFLDSRPSSESWGGSLFFIGFSFLIAQGEKKWGALIAGLFLGLAFECRYQVGILIAALLIWAFFFSKERRWFFLFCGIAIAILIGVAADFWGYGVWAFTPWHYFEVNILQEKAAEFGVQPWWYYFFKIIQKGPAPLGILLLVGVMAFWVRNPKHPLTWVSLTFFLTHSALPHKETRFLFPLASVAPMMLVFGLKGLETFMFRFKVWQAAAVLNFGLLCFASFRPTDNLVSFYSDLYHRFPGQTIHSLLRDPFDFIPTPIRFYRSNAQTFHIAADYDEIALNLLKNKKPILLAHPGESLPLKADVLNEWCIQKFRAKWSLYECKIPALLVKKRADQDEPAN